MRSDTGVVRMSIILKAWMDATTLLNDNECLRVPAPLNTQ